MLSTVCAPGKLSPAPSGRGSRLACTRGGVELAPSPLQYRNLGRSDLNVSEVCLGIMTFGEQTPEDEAHRILSHARELGVNFFDTAELYPVAPRLETQGRSSEYIGRWLRGTNQKREEVVIASKVVGNTKNTKLVGG